MEELKSLFGEGSLSYDEFEKKLTEAGDGIKLANLKSGGYVDKSKYEKLEKSFNEYKAKYSDLETSTKDFDKVKSQLDELNDKYAKLLGEKEMADKMSLISKSNVDDDFAEFVYTKVNVLTSEKKDFQTALDEYLKEHKQFLKGTNKGTYVNLENGSTPPQSANQKMNEFIRRKGK